MLRFKVFYGLLMSRGYELATLGDQSYGVQWTICPKLLNANSVVYSGGVGEDISFEHALVQRFGCKVVLCDPSPTGIKTMALPQNQLPQFQFLPVGLAARSGSIKMASPKPGDFSWSAQADGTATTEFPCMDVVSLMGENGYKHIDLLKLDIEGCEYEIIDDILERKVKVRQLCADFDYGYVRGVRRSQAIRAMLKLRANGYRLVSHEAANHTFISEAIF
ncbi:MAG: FkbM family methyltransferase [Verrucomicrobia bacterium]|jgi:FkbM family methyltransferase|nr:FkbM family methyltransferase [Verrucomicrobiota bacterium]